MSQHLQAIYDTRVAEGLLRPDPAQREVLLLLEELREKLEDRPAKPSGFLGRFFKPAVPEGVCFTGRWPSARPFLSISRLQGRGSNPRDPEHESGG